MLPVTTQVELFQNNPVPKKKKWCCCFPKKKKMHRYQPTRVEIDVSVQQSAKSVFETKSDVENTSK